MMKAGSMLGSGGVVVLDDTTCMVKFALRIMKFYQHESCGWCIPFLKQIYQQALDGGETELERLTPEEYESRRAQYIRAGNGTPPPGATPLPPEKTV